MDRLVPRFRFDITLESFVESSTKFSIPLKRKKEKKRKEKEGERKKKSLPRNSSKCGAAELKFAQERFERRRGEGGRRRRRERGLEAEGKTSPTKFDR